MNIINPRSAGSKELLNNFKILTGQGLCESLSCSWAHAKPKNRLVVMVNPASIFFLMTNALMLFDKKINSRVKYF
jgi:hypothetical protein